MIKPEYKNIPDTEFVPLTENEVRKDLAGLYEINKKGEVRNVKTKRILIIQTTKNYPRVNLINRIYLIHILLAKKFIIIDNQRKNICRSYR